MAVVDLTAARLRELLHYDPDTGVFTWLRPTGRRVRPGDVAGGSSFVDGYSIIRIDGRIYKQHRLACLWMTGEWPLEVDHRDGNRANNRWLNLRDVTRRLNQENKRVARSDNTSGLLGVSFQKREQKYRAQIQIDGRKLHLGEFHTPEEAHAAYLAAKRTRHLGCTI